MSPVTHCPAPPPASRFLKNTWYVMAGAIPLYTVLGNVLGQIGNGYFMNKFYYILFFLSVLIAFFVIPGVRSFIYRRAGGDSARAGKRAALATWALAQCIALFGLYAYLTAADKGTFYGLLLGSFIVMFNFRPREILS